MIASIVLLTSLFVVWILWMQGDGSMRSWLVLTHFNFKSTCFKNSFIFTTNVVVVTLRLDRLLVGRSTLSYDSP